MPLGAPIGTNRGLRTKEMVGILIEEIDLPIVVDAGIGRPSQACEAMITATISGPASATPKTFHFMLHSLSMISYSTNGMTCKRTILLSAGASSALSK